MDHSADDMLDPTDRHILMVLQRSARTSNADLARELGMAPSAIHERIRKLEQRGCITGYEARVNPVALGLGLTAFVFVRAEERPFTGETGRRLAAVSEVLEVHSVAGEDCYLVKLRVRDTAHLTRVMREGLGAIDSVVGTRTVIVLETVRESALLPLSPGEASGAEEGS